MSKTPDLDMSIPVVSLTLFDDLPKELRLYIWMHALPNLRIIHLERHLLNAEGNKKGYVSEDYTKYLFATYFSSPSPNDSIISLLGACKESHTAVKQHHSFIFLLAQHRPPSLSTSYISTGAADILGPHIVRTTLPLLGTEITAPIDICTRSSM